MHSGSGGDLDQPASRCRGSSSLQQNDWSDPWRVQNESQSTTSSTCGSSYYPGVTTKSKFQIWSKRYNVHVMWRFSSLTSISLCTMGRLRRSRTHHAQRDVRRASRTRVCFYGTEIEKTLTEFLLGSDTRFGPNTTYWFRSQSTKTNLAFTRIQSEMRL